MNKKSILSALLALILLVTLGIPVAATDIDLQLQCGNAVLIDGTYGDVLYDQNAYEKAYPASMTKVMTALLTLEAIETGVVTEDTLVTVSKYAAQKDFADESTANLQPGEEMSVKDLLYCLMLPSANDAAKALAEHLGGTCDAFAETMNQRAQELGCKDTHFKNPNGLHDPEHYTTAYDVALMFKEAMRHALFLEIIATADYTTAPTNMNDGRYFFNTNGLISNFYYSGHVYEKCIGGKTGSTTEAGKCLVAAAKDGDRLVISVVMGSGPITGADGSQRLGQFDESKRLLEYGLLNFRRISLSQPDEVVTSVAVSLSKDGDSVGVKPRGALSLILPATFDETQVQTSIQLFADAVEAPVEEGQVMGTMRLYTEDRDLGELELVAEKSLTYSQSLLRKQQFGEFMNNTGKKILIGFVIILLLPVVALISIRYINIYRRKQRKKRAAQRRAAQSQNTYHKHR